MTQFLVQLEYWHGGDWQEVVRYDHDRDAPGGHDVTEEGLHRDVYRNGEKYTTEPVTPPIPAGEAFNYAKDDLREKLQRFTERFKRWHGVNGETDL